MAPCKVLFFCVCFGISLSLLSAQTPKTIEGQVLDSLNRPLTQAAISIEGKGIQTLLFPDSQGFFKYAAAASELTLKVAYQQQVFYRQTLHLLQDTFLLLQYGTPSKNKLNLDTAFIQAHKKSTLESKADRFIFTPNETLKAGKSVTDLFQAVPMLWFEQANANGDPDVQIVGKASTDIYINGKRSFISKTTLLRMLSGQNAELIEKIEIIRNPNVSYDVRQGGAIVNIIMKKNNNLQGLLGNASLRGFQNTFTNYFANLYLNYKYYNRELTLSAYGGRWSNAVDNSYRNDFIALNNYKQDATLKLTQRDRYESGFNIYFSYDISPHQNLQIGNNFSYDQNQEKDYNHNRFYKVNTKTDSAFTTANQRHLRSLQNQVNINYTFNTNTKGSKFEAFFNYLFFQDNISNITDIRRNDTFNIGYLQQVPRRIHTFYLAAQYTHLFNAKHSLQGGFKSYYTHTDNPVIFHNKGKADAAYQPDAALSNYFIYREPIYNVFLSYNADWIPEFQSVIGVKIDNTYQIGTVAQSNKRLQRNWLFFLPTLHLNYIISKNNHLNYAFNSSVNKPGIGDLNPVRLIISNNFFSQGNPFLQVSRNYFQELSYTLQQKYVLLLNYDYAQNPFVKLPDANNQNTTYGLVWTNARYSHNFKMGISATPSFLKADGK